MMLISTVSPGTRIPVCYQPRGRIVPYNRRNGRSGGKEVAPHERVVSSSEPIPLSHSQLRELYKITAEKIAEIERCWNGTSPFLSLKELYDGEYHGGGHAHWGEAAAMCESLETRVILVNMSGRRLFELYTRLNELKRAIEALKAGGINTHFTGRCRGCRQPIPWERLRDAPEASVCIACA